MNDPEGTLEAIDHACGELGALGVQIYTHVNGHPLDEERFEPFWARMAELGKPVWVHPSRNASWADYPTEEVSKYEIWWVFGWEYDTAAFMARLVFSGVLERHPDLKILIHHGGSMVPHFAGPRRPGLGPARRAHAAGPPRTRSSTPPLSKRPLDYFKMFYADTAMFGAAHAIQCCIEFFGVDRILFASDTPFDPEKGPGYIRSTIENLESLDLSDDGPREDLRGQRPPRARGDVSAAYLYDAIRTPFGRHGGALAGVRPGRPRRPRRARAARALARPRPGADRRRAVRQRQRRRRGQPQRRADGGAARRAADVGAGRDRQPAVRLLAGRGDAGLARDRDRRRLGRAGRRRRVDEPRAVGAAQARARLRAHEPGAVLDHARLADGQPGDARAVDDLARRERREARARSTTSRARRRTSSRSAATGSPPRPGTRAATTTGSCRCPDVELERDEGIRPDTLGREARDAQAGVREGRHGHGRQRLAAQRRRGRAAARRRGGGRGDRARAARADRRPRHVRRRPRRVRDRARRGRRTARSSGPASAGATSRSPSSTRRSPRSRSPA